MADMDFEFEGPVVEWRGPPPYYFLRVPQEESADIKLAARGIEYWGQVPVVVRIGDVEFVTALFPRDGRYLVPLKNVVRHAAAIEVDQVLGVGLNVGRDQASPKRANDLGGQAGVRRAPGQVRPGRPGRPSAPTARR